MTNKIFILIGPSGVGKKTISTPILTEKKPVIISCISATTRPKRSHEIDKKDYYFLSQTNFAKKIQNNEFVEYTKFASHLYGTLKKEIAKKIKLNNILLEIEIQGAFRVKKLYPDSVSIFIMPPDFNELKKRILNRQPNIAQEDLQERLNTAKEEIKVHKKFDYTVFNENIIKACQHIKEIIQKTTN